MQFIKPLQLILNDFGGGSVQGVYMLFKWVILMFKGVLFSSEAKAKMWEE